MARPYARASHTGLFLRAATDPHARPGLKNGLVERRIQETPSGTFTQIIKSLLAKMSCP